jgi:hypothetical protein
VIEKRRIERDDYHLARAEVKSDIQLVMLENVPQLIIQVIYGAETASANLRTVAWYVAIFTTVLHSASQIFEILVMLRKLPELKIAAEQGKGHVPATNIVVPEDS